MVGLAETRYLRNVFERDERWESRSFWRGLGHHPSLPRGEEANRSSDTVPAFDYDLIILGEVERQLFEEHELQWWRNSSRSEVVVDLA